MKRKELMRVISSILPAVMAVAGCGGHKPDPMAEAPPPAQVVQVNAQNLFEVDHPEQFPLVAAVQHDSVSELAVTGSVNPDIAKTVPVISIATGRVAGIYARLGDTVNKGQLLLRIQSADISSAFSDYRKAIADEILARKQFDRAQELYAHGAISQNDLQIAEDTEDKARVDVETTAEHLRVLGSDPDHPTGIVEIRAPVSGVITDQQVTNAAGVVGLSSSNPFTISDLSTVWVICDVYENDLPQVQLGDTANIRLNAYPGRDLKGRVSNIGPILDPNIRTAKVRIEVENPGMLRLGMFVTAVFYGKKKETHAAVPATAILHLHDRDWVYEPAGDKKFRRLEVTAGGALPSDMQEILDGVKPGDKVVQSALLLQNTVEQ